LLYNCAGLIAAIPEPLRRNRGQILINFYVHSVIWNVQAANGTRTSRRITSAA
jgi:hypothetical protein